MKNSSCRTPPKLPGAKHSENTCFVYAARWLLSNITVEISLKNTTPSPFNCRLWRILSGFAGKIMKNALNVLERVQNWLQNVIYLTLG